MKDYLRQKYKVNVSQNIVANARSVAPNYHGRRQTDTVRHVNSAPYRADYFGHKLHVARNVWSCSCCYDRWSLRLHNIWSNNAKEKR